MAELSATAYPVEKFVSIPFNVVVLVTFGVISVHNRFFACLISISAFAMCILATQWQEDVYAEAAWKDVPAAKISQEDVKRFLTFGLDRWISSFLYHALAIKVLWRLVPISSADVAKLLKQDGPTGKTTWTIIFVGAFFFAFHLAADWDGAELSIVQSITGDWSIYYHYYAFRLAESLCFAFQVAFLRERATATKSHCHVFMCSGFMLFQTCRISTNPLDYYDVDSLYALLNIVLQSLVLWKTGKHFQTECMHYRRLLLGALSKTLNEIVSGVSKIVLHPISFATTLLCMLRWGASNVWNQIKSALLKLKAALLTSLKTLSTGFKALVCSTAQALFQPLQHLLIPLRNGLRSIRTGTAEVVSKFSRVVAVVFIQFFDAWQRQALHWQDDDYLVQDPPPVRQRIPPGLPVPRPVQCESCNSLDQSVLAVQQRLNTPPAHHTYESVLVLMEHHMEIVMEPPAPIREPVAPIVLPQNLTSLEVVPQQASD